MRTAPKSASRHFLRNSKEYFSQLVHRSFESSTCKSRRHRLKDADESRLAPAAVEALYAEFSGDLLAFLIGVLRDGELARDVLQATFARAVESGHAAQQGSVRGWLFRVAFNEALSARRKQGQHERLIRKAAWDHA